MTVSKDADGKVTMQIIGDEKLYGKDYVISGYWLRPGRN